MDNKRKNRNMPGIVLVIFLILFMWMYLPAAIRWLSPEWAISGQVGDSFGAVNALFSGLGLAGIVYTIWYQKKFNNLQNFESKFFQLLSLHHTIVSQANDNVIELCEHIGKQIRKRYEEEAKAKPSFGMNDLVALYERNYAVHRATLGHYFRHLYHIVRFVDETEEIDDDRKYGYVQILRAQLSAYEIVLLAYNGLTERGAKFKPFIEAYRLLDNLDFDGSVAAEELLVRAYPHLEQARSKGDNGGLTDADQTVCQ